MELCRGDDLGQFLHIRGLDIDNVEALVLYIQIPEIDSQVITADEGLPIAIHGYAVDVVCMGIGICASRNSCHDGVMVSHTR